MATSRSPRFIVIEGELCELHVEFGKQNLLAKINQHYRGQSAITGLAAVAGDLHGQAANAAMLAMYDGEDTQNFMCLIGGQVVCGQFAGAERLKPGNRVKAVVRQSGDVWIAAGILDETEGLAWLHHPYGSHADLMANVKLGFYAFLFVSIFFGGGSLLFSEWNQKNLEFALLIVAAAAVLAGIMALWVAKDMRALSDPSTQIFRLLGFERPERVKLNYYAIKAVEIDDHLKRGAPFPPSAGMAEGRTRDVYLYRRAIEDGKVSLVS